MWGEQSQSQQRTKELESK